MKIDQRLSKLSPTVMNLLSLSSRFRSPIFPFEDIDIPAARDEQYWVLVLPSE